MGEEETKDPAEMLRIARMYHADLQSKPPMNRDQEKAITEILGKVKIRLNKEESRDIEKSISYKEVYDVLKKAPNGKALGPDGILIDVMIYDEFPYFSRFIMNFYEFLEEGGEFQPQEGTST